MRYKIKDDLGSESIYKMFMLLLVNLAFWNSQPKKIETWSFNLMFIYI